MPDSRKAESWSNPDYSENDRKAFADFSAKVTMLKGKGVSLTKEMVDSLQDDFEKFIVPACKDESGEYKSLAHSSAFRDLEPCIKMLRAMINLNAA